MQYSYNGSTPAFQAGSEGSIPLYCSTMGMQRFRQGEETEQYARRDAINPKLFINADNNVYAAA